MALEAVLLSAPGPAIEPTNVRGRSGRSTRLCLIITQCKSYRARPAQPNSREATTYKVAGIDVHKKMLAVVVTDAAAEGEFRFQRKKFGASPSDLDSLEAWFADQGDAFSTVATLFLPMLARRAGMGTPLYANSPDVTGQNTSDLHQPNSRVIAWFCPDTKGTRK